MSAPVDNPRPARPLRRVLGNFGYLVRGRALAALLSFGATALMARVLGPTEFGVAMLIESYYLLMRGFFDFRSFDSVVRFGVPRHAAGDLRGLRRLVAVCRRVDRWSCVAGAVVAAVVAPLIGPWIGIPHGAVGLLAAYSLVMLTETNNAPSGVLRLFGRFDVIGWQMAIGAVVTFAGVVVAWWFKAPLYVFVAIMAVAQASENLYLSWRGWREYRVRVGDPAPDEDPSQPRVAEFPGMRHFLWMSYWQSNMDIVPKHLAMLLAGNLLDAAGAGLLRLARQMASLLGKSSVLIRDVSFPDLTRLWHDQPTAFRRTAYRTALLGGAVGVVLVIASGFWGADFLRVVVGEKFVAAAGLLTLMLLASTLDLTAAPLRSAVYAIGHAGRLLIAYVLAMALFLLLFVTLTQWLGLIGPGIAACAASALPLVVMFVLIQSAFATEVRSA